MFNIVLVEPEIPPNTGNIIRLCANTGCSLHLVHPLGFDMSEKQLRRAGLDYGDMTRVHHYESYEEFSIANLSAESCGLAAQATSAKALKTNPDFCQESAVCFSTKGRKRYHQHAFSRGEWLLFGSETRGLAASVLGQFADEHILRLPMLVNSRSMNLSNTVAVAVYEAWRQCDFAGS